MERTGDGLARVETLAAGRSWERSSTVILFGGSKTSASCRAAHRRDRPV
jgi:hypothetical protein